MALTRDSVIRLQQLRLIESTDLLEDSVSSVSSTSVLEKTAFFLDVCDLTDNQCPLSIIITMILCLSSLNFPTVHSSSTHPRPTGPSFSTLG